MCFLQACAVLGVSCHFFVGDLASPWDLVAFVWAVSFQWNCFMLGLGSIVGLASFGPGFISGGNN